MSASHQLHTSGQLSITDPDAGQDHFIAQANTPATYGVFTIDEHGLWTYTADNGQAAIQQLKAGATLTDSVTVSSADGTNHTVTVTLTGSNDAPVLMAQSQAVSEDGARLSGQMVASDVDVGDAQHYSVAGRIAGFVLNVDGSYTFDPRDSAYQHLAAGQTQTLTIPITVTDSAGASSTQNLTITLTGSNDGATIGGVNTGGTNEDSTQLTTGQLTVADIDDGQAHFVAQTGTAGSYGSFSLDENGQWRYQLDSSKPEVQALKSGDSVTEHFTVTSADGTTQQVTITIAGRDDTAVISGADTGQVIEDQQVDAHGLLHAGGQLQLLDPDAGEAVFVVQNAVATQYGQFSIDAHGVWTYTVDNSKPEVQALKPGGTAGETGDISGALAQVLSQSGVAGFHSVGEALTQGQLSALAGVLDLSIQGAAIVLSGPAGTTPVVYAMDAQGRANIGVDELLSWLHQGAGYEVHLQGTQSDVQVFVHDRGDEHTLHALPLSGVANLSDPLSQALHLALQWHTPPVPGELHEIVTVSSADGTQHQINLTITGTAEDAVISGTDTGSVTEDANVSGGKLEAHGQLQITDADAGQAAFQPLQDLAGQYGHLTLGADGTWTYQADNQSAAIQALNKGQSVIDSFIVHSVDGTAHTIAVTLQGADEVRTDLLGLVAAKVASEYYYAGKQLAAAISSLNGGAVSSLELSFSNGTPKVVDAAGHVLESFTSHDLFGTHVPLGHLLDLLKSHPGAQLILDGPVGSSSGFYVNNSGNPLQLNAFGLTRYNVANNALGSAPIDGIPTPHVAVTNNGNSVAVLSGADSGSVLTLDATHELTQGHLTVLDADGGQAAFVAQQHVQGQYGQFDIDADGEWHYHADSTLDAVKHLVAGQALTDQFTVQSIDGTTHQIRVQLFGAHQMAQISGVDQGQVTEDQATQLLANGQLTVSDPDPGEAHFIAQAQAQAQAHGQGRYGVFTLAADGQWTYTADSSQTAIQQLKAGASLTDVLTVQSVDGTTHAISVTINGSNDAAVIGGVSTGQVSEDATTRIQGQLTITDADQGEAAFQAQSNTHGSYGLLSIDEHGLWSYTLDNANSAVQALQSGETLTERFTVQSADGGSHTVTIAINGSNDAPVLQAQSQSVTEDGNLLRGHMVAQDADHGDTLHFSTSAAVAGFTLNADGSYSFDPSHHDYQSLGAGQDRDIAIPVIVTDSAGATASQTLSIHITGRDDRTSIYGSDSGQVQVGVRPETSGQLHASDEDAGQSGFQAGTVKGSFGSLTIDAQGHWTYQVDGHDSFVQHILPNSYLPDVVTVHSLDGTAHDINVKVSGAPSGGHYNSPVDSTSVQHVPLPQVWSAVQGQPVGGHDVFDGILAAVHAAGYQYQGLANELDKGSLAAIGNMDLSISGVHVQVIDRAGNLVQRISSTGENAATLHMSDLLLWHAQGHSIIATSDSGLDTTRMWLHNPGDMHNIQVRLPDGTGFNAWADQWTFGELHLQGIAPAPPAAPAPAPDEYVAFGHDTHGSSAYTVDVHSELYTYLQLAGADHPQRPASAEAIPQGLGEYLQHAGVDLHTVAITPAEPGDMPHEHVAAIPLSADDQLMTPLSEDHATLLVPSDDHQHLPLPDDPQHHGV
ncbi:VCBS domain-containing protein [Chitinibacter sp. ZOR0017]|uniref:VCBS domain-containing protein n=1 Tax=Chitinibacter sp. ZOR0017 TaxID=1339254 RepID=UPI000B0CD2E8|nr:VCBS domain-containing protein [Chitinibacter sp. ZOR0017]